MVEVSATRATATRRPTNRRDLILRAAVELFGERGYHATGVDDIGEAVDVSGPAIYRHFAGKEDILLEAIRKAGDRIEAGNAAALAAGEPREVVEGFVRAFARVAIDESALLAVWSSEVRHLAPERRSPVTSRIRSWTQRWVDELRRWRPELDPDQATVLVAAAIGMVRSVADRRATHVGEDQIVAMAMHLFGADLTP